MVECVLACLRVSEGVLTCIKVVYDVSYVLNVFHLWLNVFEVALKCLKVLDGVSMCVYNCVMYG